MKTLRKVLFYFALAFGVLLIAVTASVFLYKDKIIKSFIRHANEHLSTPVKVAKFDVSIFQHFPSLSIVMQDVYIEDSQPGQYPLLTAKSVSFQMDPFEMLRGTYIINGLRVSSAEVNLKVSGDVTNYRILKESETSATASGAITFELQNVALEDVIVNYVNTQARQQLQFSSTGMTASLKSSGSMYDIDATGQLTTDRINVDGNAYLDGKSFIVNSKLTYDDEAKSLTIRPSNLKMKNSSFDVSGEYSWKDANQINIKTEGKNTDIQTILSILPERVSTRFEKYKSKGNVYFKATLKGKISNKTSPLLSVDFGLVNATLFHPDYKSQLDNVSVRGSFASAQVANARKATLILKDINGKLNGETFTANFNIHNFIDPEVICDFRGRVDAASLFGFYPVQQIQNVSGALLVDVAFSGKLERLKRHTTAQEVYTQGSVKLQGVNFEYGEKRSRVQDLGGVLQFSNNDLALSGITGKFGNSDFELNGFFKNVIAHFLFERQPIGVEADLRSRFLDVDELFAIGFGASPEESNKEYQFRISPDVYLNFNCDVQRLRYKRFTATNMKGDLLVKNKVAVSRNLTFATMGGDITLSGIVDANNSRAIDMVCTSRLNDIHIDSAFYVFENFRQTFIEARHLKGEVTADLNMEMVLGQNLKLFHETLVADIGFSFRNGQLNNFEPMKKLNKYLDDEGLSKLRFSDLQNDIHIEKKTVYIPKMDIRSNVTDISISGTHTFDQQIDYRVIAPLRGKRNVETAALDATESDSQGQTKLFLKIVGTTDDYRVLYDTDAVKKKILGDFKREVQQLKDAFRKKGDQKKKEIEVQSDEYFDWEDNN